LPENVIGGGDGTEGLQDLIRNWMKHGRELHSTHFVEEIHQPSQLRPMKAGQILILFVTLHQAVEVGREICGSGAE